MKTVLSTCFPLQFQFRTVENRPTLKGGLNIHPLQDLPTRVQSQVSLLEIQVPNKLLFLDFSISLLMEIEKMRRSLEEVKRTQAHILTTQARQSAILNNLIKRNSRSSELQIATQELDRPSYDLNNYSLPLETMEDLERFEEHLEDEDYRRKFVS